jgi:thermosome
LATAIPAITSSGQQVLILKEGTSQTRGRDAQKNNIMAAKLIAELVRSSLGPRGMDKMLVDSLGDVTITNDGATILKEIDVQHPAAKMMVEISKATDQEVGDGTTSAVVFAGALLEKAEELISKDVHPTIIVDGYRKASAKALDILNASAIKISPDDREWLTKVAKTSIMTKLVSRESDVLSALVVDALLQIAEKTATGLKVDIDDVKVEKKPGGSIRDTSLIKGIILDKEVVHSGMPKRMEHAKIALINSALEIEKTEFDAKINISNPDQMKLFLDEENHMLKDMVDKIVGSGANVIICQKGIDDIAQHYLAKQNILAVRRVKQSDIEKLAKATGGRVVTSLDELAANDLGNAGLVEERNVEDDKWVFVEGAANPKAVSLLIRGGTQRIVDEADRSIHDALCVVRDVIQNPAVVAGGGAPEAHIASQLRSWSNTLGGREQLAVQLFSDAIESIPLTLAENAGLDPIDTQVELRAAQSQGQIWYGISALDGGVKDMKALNILEPVAVKAQIIKSATEAACMIIRIDDVIASSKMRTPGGPAGGPGGMGDMGED